MNNIRFVGPEDLITMRTIVGECVGEMNGLDMATDQGLGLAVGAQRTLVFTVANTHEVVLKISWGRYFMSLKSILSEEKS